MPHSSCESSVLAALFVVLLDGCATDNPCTSFVPEELNESIPLSAAEYASWQHGGEGVVTGAMSSAPTKGATTDASTTGEAMTGGATTGTSTSEASTSATSTSEASTTGAAILSDLDVCEMVCEKNYSSGQLAEMVSCSIGPGENDGKLVSCTYKTFCMAGRGHAGVRSRRQEPVAGAAAWLAAAVHDEAASVHAFTALARELAEHGAPRELLDALEDAAADEVRHAASVGALARRLAAAPPPVDFAAPPARTLVELAVENSIEGCVHETWSALVAAHQGRFADDPEWRRCFAEIASDELRHAELAWKIDAWLWDRLEQQDRARVDAARRAAVRRIAAEIEVATVDARGRRRLGLPSPVVARHLHTGLDVTLWSRAALVGAP